MGQRNTKRSGSHARNSGSNPRAAVEAMESRLLMSFTPVGGESLVNTYTQGSQTNYAVVADAQGNYVVTWTSDGQDGGYSNVYARAFFADGTPRTGEFCVNQTTAGTQASPSVAIEANGDFAVVWSGPNYAAKGASNPWSIYGRRYSAAGQPLGGEFLVNDGTADSDFPSIGMDQDGDFVVVWRGPDAMVDRKTSGSSGILAQRFDQNGRKVGASFRVNSYVPDSQDRPAVAMDAAGTSFAVTWSSLRQGGAAGYGVYARRCGVAADGSLAAGPEFKVNTLPSGTVSTTMDAITQQPYPCIGMRPDGGQFTIGWMRIGADGLRDTYARRYGAAGQPLTTQEFQPSAATTGNQGGSQVAYDAAGNSLIVWTDNDGTSSSSVGTASNIAAQAYDADGNPDGGELALTGRVPSKSGTVGGLGAGRVAFQPGGGFVLAYTSRATDDGDVFARHFVRDPAPAASDATPMFSNAVITGGAPTNFDNNDAAVSVTSAILDSTAA